VLETGAAELHGSWGCKSVAVGTSGGGFAAEELALGAPCLAASPRPAESAGCCPAPLPQTPLWLQRPVSVKVKAQDENGQKFQIKLEGWQARIFQHEFDHLLGKLFVDTDRMEASDREANHGNLCALEDAFEARNPGAAVERVR